MKMKLSRKRIILTVCLIVCILLVFVIVSIYRNSIGLTEKKKEEIAQAYGYRDGCRITWGDSAAADAHYYGTYNGYMVILVPKLSMLCVSGQAEIADFTFTHCCIFDIYAYKDKSFITLKVAYENGLITDEQIEQIYSSHQEWQAEAYE